MTPLPLLLQRVREASGPDRELDIAIGRALMGDDWLDLQTKESFLTASLDAAVALVERVRPGWTRTVTYWPASEVEPAWARCTLGGPGYISDETTSDTFEETIEGGKNIEARAVICALLASLIPQEAHDE